MSFNKQITADAVVAGLHDGMTLGIGGWGPRRKPMALVRAILRSDLRDLTVVTYGGPDAGMLAAAGKIKKLVFGFVTLDKIPVEPWFRKTREAGAIEVSELDEGMLRWGLTAAGKRLPFLPTRAGLGTDVLKHNPQLRTVTSPYDDGETFVAMPALALDAAIVHVHRADTLGNTRTFGPDPYFDALFARAATRCYVSSEQVCERLDQSEPDTAQYNRFERNRVSGVVHAPFGAYPTACAPDYGWDMAHLKTYADAARDSEWRDCVDRFVGADEAGFIGSVGGRAHIRDLALPVF